MKSMFPAIPIPNSSTSARPVGGNCFAVTAGDVTEPDYREYRNSLREAGYGIREENSIDDSVFYTALTKDDMEITLMYARRSGRLDVCMGQTMPLSPHTRPQPVQPRVHMHTRLYMMEMFYFGNSFVFQLKNGHFLVSDGGEKCEARYLVEHLESLSEGVPVVEGWFFTHPHSDHCGIMGEFVDDPALAQRVLVEGIYYSEPDAGTMELDSLCNIFSSWIRAGTRCLKTTAGEPPEIYRPKTGQRYYFDDVTVDILMSQEQLPKAQYDGDLNDSSLWCLVTVENQRILLTGDGARGGMRFLRDSYRQELLCVDVMTTMHHGFNTYDWFTDLVTPKTLLLTVKDDLPVRREKQNARLIAKCREAMPWGDGTKVLTFPYQVGSYETLAPMQWRYHVGKTRSVPASIYK